MVLVLFLCELLLLFFLSRSTSIALSKVFHAFTKSYQATVRFLAVLYLPGTILHELAHLLMAGVLFVPVGDLEVIPKIEGSSVQLGSVQIAKTDPFRRMLIGVAPIIFGLGAIFAIFFFFQMFFPTPNWWQIALLLYAVFVFANTMFSSKKDVEGMFSFLLTILIVGTLVLGMAYFFDIKIPYEWVFQIDLSFANDFLSKFILLLSVPLIIDIVIILLVRLFVKN